MRDIYNSWDRRFKNIFGALKVNQSCDFSVEIPHDVNYTTAPVMVVFRCGFKEQFVPMVLVDENESYKRYTAIYTPIHMGLHYYYFALSNNGERFFLKKCGPSKAGFCDGELFQLTVYDEKFYVPDFIKNGLMYQIFPDRFNKSGKEHSNVPSDRYIHENLWDTPFYRPNENGKVLNNDYFGGDLKGIVDKLDYLSDLGVTCIYLNPIFEAHENHRYNTADYLKVDPLLGTNDDFKELCDTALEKGIHVIIDGVFSHTGADSLYFNKFNRYNAVGAYNSVDSEFYPWFTFFEHPDKYEAWWGIDTLPNVRENNKEYTEFICGKGGVLHHWLSLGASGFRLDVADELPDGFLDALNRSVKSFDKNKLIIGEVWEDASNKEAYGVKRRYLTGGQLDSVMNYPFKDAIMEYVRGGEGFVFYDRVMTILENYPQPSISALMNFISTHDIARAITVLGGGDYTGSKDDQANSHLNHEQYEFGKRRIKVAMAIQFFLPGVPCIYYGDEVGLQGGIDPFNRRFYPWGNEDLELLSYVKKLSKDRSRVLSECSENFEIIDINNDIVAFLLSNSAYSKGFLIVINNSCEEKNYKVNRDILNRFSHEKSMDIYIAPNGYSITEIQVCSEV